MRASLVYLEVLLLLACHVSLGWFQSWSSQSCPGNACMEELNQETETNNPDSSVLCPILERAQLCLNNVSSTDGCFMFFHQFRIDNEWNRSNCTSSSSPTSTVSTLPSTTLPSTTLPSSTLSSSMPTQDPDCPRVSDFSIVELEAAITVPLSTSRECDLPDPTTMEHCSALMFSHVRPFKGYHSGIQTCSLPGAWYLLRHSSFSVEVEGGAVGTDSPLTFLKKVNITFSPHPCSPQRTYFADGSLPLPSTFADGSTPLNTNSPLQLTVSGTVTSILATWLNTTIVLRQYAGYLSVTIQVPGMLAFESEGLCTGCPAHTQNINISTEIVTNRETCPIEINNKAVLNCYLSGGVVNIPEFSDVDNASYREMCIFDVLRAESLQVISLIKAATIDARELVPIGTVPRQEPGGPSSSLPTRFPILDLETEPPEPTTQATQRVDHSTNSQSDSHTDSTTVTVLPSTIRVSGISSAPSQSYHLVNLLTVLVTVLVASLLR